MSEHIAGGNDTKDEPSFDEKLADIETVILDICNFLHLIHPPASVPRPAPIFPPAKVSP